MPTLTIGSSKVKVDDSFLSLPKDQQQQVVNRIAAQIAAGHQNSTGATAPAVPATGPPPGAVPGSKEYAAWAVQQAKAGNALPQVSQTTPSSALQPSGLEGVPVVGPLVQGAEALSNAVPHLDQQIMAGTSAAANAIPIAGPAALQGLENARGAIQHMTPAQVDAETKAREAAYPMARDIGTGVGRVAPFVAAAGVPGLATVLGFDMGAPLVANMVLGGASQKAIDFADQMMRGSTPQQANDSSNTAALGGIAAPVLGPIVGKGIEASGKLIGRGVDTIQAMLNPEAAAAKMAGKPIAADIAAGDHMSGTDLATARQTQQPMVNADIFGDKTKTLLQTALPANPGTMEAVQKSMAERAAIGARKDRTAEFFNDVTGGNTNFQLAQEAANAGRRATNGGAYDVAYAAAPKEGIWTPRIEQMVSVPNSALRDAIEMTTTTGANEALAKGTKAIVNPFKFTKDGNYTLTGPASLPFWDQVQQNLGKLATKTSGYDSANIQEAQRALNGELDNVVPQFADARQGAAKFFDANDALEAGQKFAMSNADPNVAGAEIAKFSAADQRRFGIGAISKIMNVVQQAGSPATLDRLLDPAGKAAQQIKVALSGWPKYVQDQIPSWMRVQQALQDTNKFVQAASASKLGQQLGRYGTQSIGGAAIGAAGEMLGGATNNSINPADWNFGKIGTGAAIGLAIADGLKLTGAQINRNVLKRVADMLSSGNPADLKAAITYATKNPQASQALRVISHGMNSLAQKATASAGLLAAPTAAQAQQPGAQP